MDACKSFSLTDGHGGVSTDVQRFVKPALNTHIGSSGFNTANVAHQRHIPTLRVFPTTAVAKSLGRAVANSTLQRTT